MSSATLSGGATEPKVMLREAVLSADRRYRYRLTRRWDMERDWLGFVMLNPSTADGETDDATISKIIGFAKRMGAGGIWVTNLYAFRATNPKVMRKAADPVGPDNDQHIRQMLVECPRVVAAYGAHQPKGIARVREVERILLASETPTFAFAYTLHGFPRHPLYLANETKLQRFEPAPGNAVT